MRITLRFSAIPFGIVAMALATASPATFASGTTSAAAGTANAAAKPSRPDTAAKVWTNEDVIALGAPYREPGVGIPAEATSDEVPVIQGITNSSVAPIAAAAVVAAPLNPEQDPRWYAAQMASLEGQLAAIDTEAQRLRNFQATGAGVQTGLTLNAPCDGITTSNLLAQLDAGRQRVLEQIDELSDTARRNDIQPGVITSASVEAGVPLSPSEQKAALTKEFQERSDELAQTREEVRGMQAQVAAQNMTLLQPSPGDGGNMTTDLLQRLDERAQTIQSQINNVEEDARGAGVEPGSLR